jgi:hypothetical protein
MLESPIELNFYEYLPIPDFTFPNPGSFSLTPARTIFEADVPAMPTADHFAFLHNAFAQGESEMRTEVLDRINPIIPAEECDV